MSAYLVPIEIRVSKHPNGGYTFYTLVIVYPGVDNVAYGHRKFMTRKDVADYCKQEWHGVPVIYN